jgi:hypothetical protein
VEVVVTGGALVVVDGALVVEAGRLLAGVANGVCVGDPHAPRTITPAPPRQTASRLLGSRRATEELRGTGSA